MSIPVLDASALSEGTAEQRAEFATKLLDSLITHGFAKLVNHTVPVPLVQETFDQIKAFFKLSYAVKGPLKNDPKNGQQRGWSVPGEEKTWWLESNNGEIKEPNFGDNKESFDCGHPDDKQFPNVWPPESELPGYQDTMDRFFFSCGDLTLVLLQAMAEGLCLDPTVFTSRCTNEASTIRINHFPPIERKTLDDGKISRIWPHKDFGIISLVFPDVTPGLEYEDRSNPGTFIPMPYGSDKEVVVIVSETMQRWTNGQIGGGLHRVTRPQECDEETVPERWSLVYFNKADRHVNVGPLKEFLQDQKPMYEDLTALEYQTLRNAAHYPG
ncbi:Oxoglutarate/iron-dependent dioxygenase [Penicillium cf. griseofulvum]|uniref:Oxoglutarate/iron-dependent dioxygenase n=1 Tax=Penicillium cf. griseofulvum TaxID=2972120 RepID=A0A9W9J1J8_9EURO|nr:Oxoglutarate/iron-dependent dioxygenase [Penicillium cf. griseofulvum]KAJ5429263.1 Oxoglutarate/iron-dependent dioxygenase [Penicillium cf. griseofulvum]KAJ5436944.1 Oxoglutarate/iron-dependent dioxygenase [Penicillium cf. griseofulvum]